MVRKSSKRGQKRRKNLETLPELWKFNERGSRLGDMAARSCENRPLETPTDANSKWKNQNGISATATSS
jgi:hypothetical protein